MLLRLLASTEKRGPRIASNARSPPRSTFDIYLLRPNVGVSLNKLFVGPGIFGEVLASSGTLQLKQKLLWLFLHAGQHSPIDLACLVRQLNKDLAVCDAGPTVVGALRAFRLPGHHISLVGRKESSASVGETDFSQLGKHDDVEPCYDWSAAAEYPKLAKIERFVRLASLGIPQRIVNG